MSDSLVEIAHKLGERVKELNCLYGITRIVEQPDITLDEILRGVIELIPPSWQYPEVTCARIKLADREYTTDTFRRTRWKQVETITADHQVIGRLEVYYLKAMPASDEGPFLAEERHLIHVLAERLGHIIQQKNAEERLHALYEQEKTLRQRLEKEAQRRIDFTRDLIHELKTPLTSLLATSQLLHDEEQGSRLEKLAGYVMEGASSLNERIDELHDVIKGEVGGLKLDLKPVGLEKLLRSVAEETQPLAQQVGCEVRLEVAGNVPPINADAARVRQVVFNLLNNVFKYAPGSGEVLVACRAEDGKARVTVKDRGPGIPERERQDIFMPGYQSEQNRTSAGLGIGLALCRLLVELHGGTIGVESRPPGGTSFFFTLPLASRLPDGRGGPGTP